ncbi:ligase-associated DNA damage response endonuclease PdeM [Frigidibacter sp. SD6-1]|uniref:ligase-associated DNA damage response endonuclease PdeM n=1 Tax=Frigidibacter sp. SD6-1 TaxID=3032581 RepID=UPI0024DF6BB8|nr:ligase-associated DNA damage response endonuclease PdeM [Frigidibacter sp. SD6-1]
MGGFDFDLQGARLTALPSGALYWAAEAIVTVSDLHLGRSERYARRGGALIPPYETSDTLSRLDADLDRTGARTVICLGDSFDDLAASALPEADALWLARMQAGRRWVWIEGNHDPGPVDLGGAHLAAVTIGPLTFRHIALDGAAGEISGHYHPKVRLAGQARPAFLTDGNRAILPAYGTYTGGMEATHPDLRGLFEAGALAILTGSRCVPCPLSR